MRQKEAAAAYGISEDLLKKWRKRGKVQATWVNNGWEYSPPGAEDYEAILKAWQGACRAGRFNNKPMSERTIECYQYGLDKFWDCLKQPPSIHKLTAQALDEALSTISVDHERRSCGYAQKKMLYDGVTGLMRWLVKKGLRTPPELAQMREHRPKRAYPAKRKVVQSPGLAKLITQLQTGAPGMTDFDQELSMTIIYLMAYAGLRKSEVITLSVHDVNIRTKELHIVCGKGLKNRWVGIQKALDHQLQRWLVARPESNSPRLLVQANGKPITKSVVDCRFKRLSKRLKIDFSSHALRRAFATIHADKGVPLSHLQEQLGHSKIETTMGYVMTDQRVAMESLKRL